MTLQPKILYHQIHPAKLLTDWAAGFAALYFFWERREDTRGGEHGKQADRGNFGGTEAAVFGLACGGGR